MWQSAGPVLRTISDLDDSGLRKEPALRIEGARVVYANLSALRHDFPALRSEALASRHRELHQQSGAERAASERALIERWLLSHGAVISARQAEPNTVNTPVRTAPASIAAYRPTRYGRALVVTVEGGLLDIKGAGVGAQTRPDRSYYGTGLCELSETVRDLLMQWIIDELLRRTAPDLFTVPVYAVLDLGFDVHRSDGALVPAGAQLRRAHRRPRHGAEIPPTGSPEELLKAEVELVLRSHGLTSCSAGTRFELFEEAGRLAVRYGGKPVQGLGELARRRLRRLARFERGRAEFDAINVQLARDVQSRWGRAQLVDFGQYQFEREFTRPLVNLVRDRPLRFGGVLWPDDPRFVRPHPALHLTLAGLGLDAAEAKRPMTALDGFVDALCTRFRDGTLTGPELVAELESRVADCFARRAVRPVRVAQGSCGGSVSR